MRNEQDKERVPARKRVLFEKKGQISERAKERRRKARANRMAAAERGVVRIKPKQARFLAELTQNGGNVSAAARAVEVHPSTAHNWMQKKWIAEAYQQIVDDMKGAVQDWNDLLGRAQRTMLDLLDADDARVRADMAKYIINRAQGMPTQKVDQTVRGETSLSEVEMQAALSLVQGRGLRLREATRYVREHPEEVQAWARAQVEQASQGALPPAEMVDAEVVE